MGVIRKTKSVKTILDAFSQSNNALSVVELVKRFQKEMNKTTVYRILERLEDEGQIHSFIGKDGLKWVALRIEDSAADYINDHAHFQCHDCGKSECLSINISIPPVPNHKINSSNLLLVGQCADCLS